MKSFISAGVLFIVGATLAAATPFIDEAVGSLTLNSGTVLENARAKSFTDRGVVVQHRGGLQTIAYEQFPDAFQPLLQRRRPAPKSAAQIAEEQRQLEARKAAERSRLEAARKEQAIRAATVRQTASREDRYSPEELKLIKSGTLWIVNVDARSSVAFVTVENDGDYTTTFEWRQVRGLRRDQTYVEPNDAKANGSSGMGAFDVPPRSKRTFTVGFGAYAYNGNWLKTVHWK